MPVDPAGPMIEWINTAPIAELATELFHAFGSHGVRNGEAVNAAALADWMFRDYPPQTGFIVTARPVEAAIMEAVQLLEHSELVYLRWTSNDVPVWSVTRLGTSLLINGREAVRQRIRDRTGL